MVGAGLLVVDVDDEQILLELRRAARHLAVGTHDDGAAVEDQLVLAAHGVHVGDPSAELTGAITQDAEPLLELPAVVGGPLMLVTRGTPR